MTKNYMVLFVDRYRAKRFPLPLYVKMPEQWAKQTEEIIDTVYESLVSNKEIMNSGEDHITIDLLKELGIKHKSLAYEELVYFLEQLIPKDQFDTFLFTIEITLMEIPNEVVIPDNDIKIIERKTNLEYDYKLKSIHKNMIDLCNNHLELEKDLIKKYDN